MSGKGVANYIIEKNEVLEKDSVRIKVYESPRFEDLAAKISTQDHRGI